VLRPFNANIFGTACIIWISYGNYPTLYAVSTESSFTGAVAAAAAVAGGAGNLRDVNLSTHHNLAPRF